MLTESAGRFAVRYGLVPRALDTQAVYDGLYAASPASFWLDSNSAGNPSARFSFLGDDRGPLSEILTGSGGAVSVRDRRGVRAESGDLSGVLDARLAGRRIGPTCLPFDLVGGYVGYSGPERGWVRDLDPFAQGNPDARWMFADRIVVVDHQAGVTYLVAVEDGRVGVRIAADAWIVDTMRRVRGLPSQQLDPAEPLPIRSARDDQLSADRILDRYRTLRRSHPAPYAALLRFGETALLSAASSSALRTFGGRPAPPTSGRPTAPARPLPLSTTESLQRCLLAATGTGIPGEPGTDLGAGLDPAAPPIRLGYFGLAGGVDLSLFTPVAVPRRAAAFQYSTAPLAGTAEPAA
ncbi:MAG: hypothetical protein JO144_03525 [Actinobacteria bacterium]|nr:hypothetical protein [Actinomycetota bacterium]